MPADEIAAPVLDALLKHRAALRAAKRHRDSAEGASMEGAAQLRALAQEHYAEYVKCAERLRLSFLHLLVVDAALQHLCGTDGVLSSEALRLYVPAFNIQAITNIESGAPLASGPIECDKVPAIFDQWTARIATRMTGAGTRDN